MKTSVAIADGLGRGTESDGDGSALVQRARWASSGSSYVLRDAQGRDPREAPLAAPPSSQEMGTTALPDIEALGESRLVPEVDCSLPRTHPGGCCEPALR